MRLFQKLVRSALRIGEWAGVDDIPTGQLELIAGKTRITFPHQRAHVGSEITTEMGVEIPLTVTDWLLPVLTGMLPAL
jgi:hypothetical protein